MKKIIAAAVALSALAMAAAPAAALTYPAAGVNAQEVAAVIKAKGLTAEVTTDEQGDPMIKGRSNDLNWRVYFYECKEGRCASLQFSAGFDLDDGLTLAKCNEWNYTKRYGRCALDGELDPYVRYDVDVAKGFSSDSLAYAVETWTLVVPTFSEFIGY